MQTESRSHQISIVSFFIPYPYYTVRVLLYPSVTFSLCEQIIANDLKMLRKCLDLKSVDDIEQALDQYTER